MGLKHRSYRLFRPLVCLYFIYLPWFCSYKHHNFLSIFPKKILFTNTSIGKCLYCMKSHPVRFVLAQFCPKKAMGQAPCFDIEYWGSYGPFLSNKSQWNRILMYVHRVALTFLIFNRIIFRFDGFQPHHCPVISTVHMLVSINQTLRTLLLKIHHGHFHSSLTGFFKYLVQTWFSRVFLVKA